MWIGDFQFSFDDDCGLRFSYASWRYLQKIVNFYKFFGITIKYVCINLRTGQVRVITPLGYVLGGWKERKKRKRIEK